VVGAYRRGFDPTSYVVLEQSFDSNTCEHRFLHKDTSCVSYDASALLTSSATTEATELAALSNDDGESARSARASTRPSVVVTMLPRRFKPAFDAGSCSDFGKSLMLVD
jgi:hypothetical protein